MHSHAFTMLLPCSGYATRNLLFLYLQQVFRATCNPDFISIMEIILLFGYLATALTSENIVIAKYETATEK